VGRMPAQPQNQNQMAYVGGNTGTYAQDSQYRFVGQGGDLGGVRPKRDYTCLIAMCMVPLLLLAIPCLIWFCWSQTHRNGIDCQEGFQIWQTSWSAEKKAVCCMQIGLGCASTFPATPPPTPPPTLPPTQPSTQPPTAPPTQVTTPSTSPPTAPPPNVPPQTLVVDQYNCFVDPQNTWPMDKRDWCCKSKGLGCASPGFAIPAAPVALPSVDPYDCHAGFTNWQAGWSASKKDWCCRNKHLGCEVTSTQPPAPTTTTFDCTAGLSTWASGWSIPKKNWCCKNKDLPTCFDKKDENAPYV